MTSLSDKIEKDGVIYYLYITYQPCFDKSNGEYIHHEYVISYISNNKILTLIRNTDLDNAVRLTIEELEKL